MSATGIGPVVARGRTAEVHRLDDGRVLKLFQADVPEAEIAAEERNCALVLGLGATPIACHGTLRVGDRTGLVFDALHGVSLTRLAERNILRLRAIGRLLGRLHAGLHAHRTEDLPDVREVALAALDRPALAFLDPAERATAGRLIRALPDGTSVLHMDYHSENVFTHDGRHATIDWQTALRGPAAADVASTRLLLHDAELWPGTPLPLRILYGTVRRILLGAYLAEYLRVTGMTRAEVDRWALPIAVLRVGTWDIASERARLRARIRNAIGRAGDAA